MGQSEQAIEAFHRALALRPNFPQASNNLGIQLNEVNRQEEGVASLRKAVADSPDFMPAWLNLALALSNLVEYDESLSCFDRAIALQPEYLPAHEGRLCTLHYHPGYDAGAIYQEARRWNDRFARPLAGAIQPHANDPSPGRRLRIGYVSADFRRHCSMLFIAPLIAAHDRSRFEIFCYGNMGAGDGVTARLRRQIDGWRDIAGQSDQAASEMIRQDKIDILVDLGLHVVGGRLGIFARKPAPVQATWLGYPGTTGLDAMDYRLTDPQLDPLDSESEIRNPKPEIRTNGQNPNVPISNNLQNLQDFHEPLSHWNIGTLGVDSDFGFRISDFCTKEPYYSERSIRLPDCFWCYDPRGMEDVEGGDQAVPGPLPALNSGHVTFGCLNNFCKVTDPTLELWSRVMKAMGDSRLILLAPPGEHRKRIVGKLGVKEERVEFVGRQERRLYLETYQRIDIGLDTIPYNGHTTSLDALWMGVPVVTRIGKTVVGRAGWSHLHNLGLMELVAHSDEAFVNQAVELGKDLKKLENLHQTLRTRMEKSPLMDGKRFTGNMEKAYRANVACMV